jgi:hypothetical protein
MYRIVFFELFFFTLQKMTSNGHDKQTSKTDNKTKNRNTQKHCQRAPNELLTTILITRVPAEADCPHTLHERGRSTSVMPRLGADDVDDDRGHLLDVSLDPQMDGMSTNANVLVNSCIKLVLSLY